MKTVKTQYNRRSFLKVSAAASGGLMVGISWLTSCNPSEAEQKSPPKEWFEINTFLKIGDNGLVTIISPNPEIGQNVKTAMPMIVAEELEVNWADVVVEQGALNTEWYTRQVAGGSQSIRQGWDALRMVGASAKQMLVAAAAQKWGVEPATCTVSNGEIKNAKGEKIGFGEIASAAAGMPVPTEIVLKEAKDYKIIGQGKGNVDIHKIVTGQPLFGIDTKREGMKYAVVTRPPFYAKTVETLDDSEAKKVNGVIDVIRFTVPRMEGFDLEKVAVVATSTWAAIKGQRALKITWKNDTTPESTALHDEKLLALFDKTPNEIKRTDGDVKKAFAEAEEVFEKTYESPFLPHNCMEPMNFFAHVTADKIDVFGPIQTPEWARGRIVDLLTPKTGDEATDTAAAAATAKKVNLGMSRMGGGFGRRLFGDFVLEAVKVSELSKQPIQLIWTREDDMSAGTYRPAIKYRVKAAIKGGQMTAYQLSEAAINQNMYGLLANGFPASAVENYQINLSAQPSNLTTGAWRAPYSNFLATAEQCFLDEVAEKMGKDSIDFRLELLAAAKKTYDAHAAIEASFEKEKEALRLAIETQKFLAKQLNVSEDEGKAFGEKIAKLEESLKAIDAKIGEATKNLPQKGNYEPDRYIEVLKVAKEKSGWGKAAAGEFLGFSSFFSHNSYVAEVAHLVMKDGKPIVKKVTCVVDCGLVINPKAATNLVQGGVIDGLGHALYGSFEIENGMPTAKNFDKYRMIRMPEAPEVEVHFINSQKSPTGLGEPPLPPAAAAFANAMYAATKKRLYKQPYLA